MLEGLCEIPGGYLGNIWQDLSIVTLGSLKHTGRPRSRPRAARPETGSRAKH